MVTVNNIEMQGHKRAKYVSVFLHICVSLYLIFHIVPVQAQVSAMVDLSKKSVYVQQPFRVNITVYTTTWFTAPLEFTNLQIPNAFIIPFDDTQPGMFNIGGKQYPGIQFYYIVFPYKAGTFTVPPLEIVAQSPPEGSSTSRKITIHTKEQQFTVLDVPQKLKEEGDWFVAKGVNMTETWRPSLANLKVGDVVTRIIEINATGTLPQFIPDISNQEKEDWASVYPGTPTLTDTRGGGDVNGKSRIEATYLLEKKGDFELTPVKLSYWNPLTNKINTVYTPKQTLHVADNPNLGIIATLRDSLNTAHQELNKPAEKKPLLIFGLKWYQFLGLLAVVVFASVILFRLGIRVYRRLALKRRQYLQSEQYLFRKFMRSKEQPQFFLPALYRWWDSLRNKPSASVGASLSELQEKEAEAQFKEYLTKAYQNNETVNAKAIKEFLKKIRKKR